MNVLFNSGDEIIFIGCPKGKRQNPDHPELIEGKKYHVKNPCADTDDGVVWITLHQYGDEIAWDQLGFIKADTDQQLENEIHEALKGVKIENL